MTSIFFTGATGYIGGAVLQRLLDHPKSSSFQITALVRSEEKAKKLNTLGVKTAVGSLDDLDKLSELASEAEVVIHAAHSDHVPAIKAILDGIKKRHEKTGEVPILIHTSGTGVLSDDAKGDRISDTVYNDTNVEQIESLAPTQIHRDVDLEIVAADKSGYVRSFIILPSAIYGVATGSLVDLGISNPHSILVPYIVRASLERGQGGMIGEGKNLWPNVEIHETADLFIVVFDRALTDPSLAHGREGFYFGENGEHQQYDVYRQIAQTLFDLGKGKSPEPTTFTDEENRKYLGGLATSLGANSRALAERSKAVGWKPVKTTADFLASIRSEVESVIAQQESQK